MKRIVTTVITVLLASTAMLNAQLVRGYGIKAAFVSASQTFDYTTASVVQSSDLGLKRRAGLGAGVYCELLNLPVFSVVTQAEYRQGGVGMKYYHTGPNGEDLGLFIDYTRIDYLSLAVQAKARIPGTITSPYLLVGLRRDRMVGTGDTALVGGLYDQFEKDITGLTVGGGVELPRLLPVKLIVEARYDLDLSDAFHGEYLTVRNNSMSLWLGVGF
jgi:hypothetical protein